MRREGSAVPGATGKPAACRCRMLGSGIAQRPPPSSSSSSSSPGPTAGVCWAATCSGAAHPQPNLGLAGGGGDGETSPCCQLCHGAASGRGHIPLRWASRCPSRFPALPRPALPSLPRARAQPGHGGTLYIERGWGALGGARRTGALAPCP